MEFYEERRERQFVSEEIKELPKEKTEIQNYYKGKTVLVTGATGFLGTLIIEKLFRRCPDMKKLIVILRSKRGKTLQQRAKDHFNDTVYDKMKQSNPNYWKKVEIVYGDCAKPYYNMEPDEWNRLQNEINVIFHSAATTRFDEHIRISYNINVAGTKYLLKLAEGARNLTAFVYLSTAYSQSHLSHIEEKFYATPFDDEQMTQLLEELDNHTLACMTPIILDGRFNTYVMTKAMAENVMKTYVNKLPLAIFRPAIVVATMEEPLVSWTNSVAGATGVFAGTAAGFLRTLYCDPMKKAELIPADRVINALLAVPLHIQEQDVNNNERQSYIPSVRETILFKNRREYNPIYNYVAVGNTITWSDEIKLVSEAVKTRNMENVVIMWRHHLCLEKNYLFWVLQYYILHLVPVPAFILMEKFSKLPPRIWKGYVRLYRYTILYSFFMVNTWNFTSKNVSDLISFTSKEDQILFNRDNNINWTTGFYNMTKGVPAYILKIRWDTFDEENLIKGYCVRFIDGFITWTFKGLFIWLLAKLAFNLMDYIHIMMTNLTA